MPHTLSSCSFRLSPVACECAIIGMPPSPGRNRFAPLDRTPSSSIISGTNVTASKNKKSKVASPTSLTAVKKPKLSVCNSPPLSRAHSTHSLNAASMDCSTDVVISQPIVNASPSVTPGATDSQLSAQDCFAPNYYGPLHVIISSLEGNNIGNLHPIKVGKLFTKNFNGITNISPIGSSRIKITFDSLSNANTCLSSSWLPDNKYAASIPRSLIYSLGVIRLDLSVSEEDFWEGVECCCKVVEYRRINVKRDNVPVPSKLVELKFLSPRLPDKLNIFKVIHEISPSIRSPVQCLRCLRFGHTRKFCRSKERCSHCGEFNHSLDTCMNLTSPPKCFNCKLDHVASDRSCSEWSTQRDIKRIMAVENKSYIEAAQIKRSRTANNAFSYADVSNSNIARNKIPPIVKEASLPLSQSAFPLLSNFQPKKKKRKTFNHNNSNTPQFPIPVSQNIPSFSPNGTFFAFADHSAPKELGMTWINSLTEQISSALLHSPDDPFNTPSTLKSLIESSLHKFLTANSYDDETF